MAAAAISLTMPVRRRRAAPTAVAAATAMAIVLVAAATVTSAAVVAAVAPPPAGGWARQLSTKIGATLPSFPAAGAVARPLVPGVSIFTDGTYGPVPGETLPAGCPTSFAITGDLGATNNSFLIPAPRVSVSGEACSGEVGLFGVFGPRLSDLLTPNSTAELIGLDPKGAAATGDGGPLTCGGTSWAGEEQGFVFLLVDTTPVLQYFGEQEELTCILGISNGAPAPSATPAPA